MEVPTLGIVVPCYNEQAVLNETYKRLSEVVQKLMKLNKVSESSFILFVDDGSRDQTWRLIKELKSSNHYVKGLKLSGNFGHQNALLAGLMNIKDRVDCAISIDADLQQDERAIESFVEKYLEGYEIVYGIRNDRNTDSIFKKFTALFFYKLMQKMGANIIKNHADYRLLGKNALSVLAEYKEINLFLRGIFPSMGFRSTEVFFDVRERFAGESKYPFRKMVHFALDGITSFSIIPIQVISIIGFLVFVFSLLMSGYTIYSKIMNDVIPGWASTLLPVYFLGGVQLLSLGVIGEYVGKIYKETKRRPRYVVEEEI